MKWNDQFQTLRWKLDELRKCVPEDGDFHGAQELVKNTGGLSVSQISALLHFINHVSNFLIDFDIVVKPSHPKKKKFQGSTEKYLIIKIKSKNVKVPAIS